ncbi:MAG: integration host factor subunit beta [Deltaproteobacteria bacterium]|jgi:integration host factor subunit beta|nr:integration host factor subunit beta [Deltaproteobacteria bacterium]
MVKSDLIEKLKNRTELSRSQAEKVVDIFFDAIADAMSQGDRAEIRGFGSFSVNSYESYTGRNPKTGARIEVPSKKLPFFRVGKELKENVDKNKGG